MVYYFINTASEPDKIRNPGTIMALWAGVKGMQVGLATGVVLGAVWSFRRGKKLRLNDMFLDATKTMRNFGAAGFLISFW